MRSSRCPAAFALILLSAACSLGYTAAANAQGPSRQTASVALSQPRPASSTGVHIMIEYRNPNDPATKPFAVQRIVTTLPAGTVIDTGVPAQCALSDAELMAGGAGACPAASIVGSGVITLSSATADPTATADVALVNNANELIFVATVRGTPTRMIVHSPVRGNTISSEIPRLPGGLPDGATALRTVDLRIGAVTRRDGATVRNYITTPSACPASGQLTSSGAFTYFDGVSQTVPSQSPCVDTVAPRIKLTGPARPCVQRRPRTRVRVTDNSSLRAVVVRLNGRRIKTTRRKTFGVTVRRERLRKGRNRLTVLAVDSRGNRSTLTRRFRRCG